jgi:5-formyltetrahydrofolate cyclo-ligase
MLTNLSRPQVNSVGPLALERQAARQRLTEWRMALPESDYQLLNGQLVSHLLSVLRDPNLGRGCLALFNPIKREPDLSAIYQPLLNLGYTLALPVVVARATAMKFLKWQPGQALVKDAVGMAVPKHTDQNDYIEPNRLVIPCVGFTASGFRLGFGGGYYDRTLAQLKAPTIGIGFGACEIKNLAVLETDLPLDQIVTEHGLR